MVKIAEIRTKYPALDNECFFSVETMGVKSIDDVDDYYMVQYTSGMVLSIPKDNIASILTENVEIKSKKS